MATLITKSTMLVLTLLLVGLLAACAAGQFFGVYYVGDLWSENTELRREYRNRPNHYDPIISFASDRIIRVKYLDNDENAQPNEAMYMISKHCNDSFKETSRRTSHGVTYIEAECT